MRLKDLQARRVAVLGFGKEGQAVCQTLQQQAREIDVTVLAEQPLAADAHCPYPVSIAPLESANLSSFEVLIKSPGISLYHPAIQSACKAGSVLTSGTNLWFAENPNARVVAITGTKGKSTTAALSAHLLSAAGLQVQLAGNIGLPVISCLGREADVWVFELSSYQLADLQAQPELAVLVSLFAEHLVWHGGSQQYFSDKLRLLSISNRSLIEHELLCKLLDDPVFKQWLPVKGQLQSYNDAGGWQALDQGLAYAGKLSVPLDCLSLRGRHNHVNTCAALSIADYFGIDRSSAIAAVATFQPLPHRLEVVAEHNGVLYVNDSIATTPMATIKAMQAFAGQAVILIAGGFDKGRDWQPLIDAVQQQQLTAVVGLRAVLALPDNGLTLLAGLQQVLTEEQQQRCVMHAVDDLSEAVKLANDLSQPGDVVLLSPGAASFSQYRNFEHRGDEFRQLARLIG